MLPKFRKNSILLCSTTALAAVLFAPSAHADALSDMERQIHAMQTQLSKMKKEHDVEMKRIHAQLAAQREGEERSQYATRRAYMGQPNPSFVYPNAQAPSVSVAMRTHDDGRPAPDRGSIMSWKDFQAASTSDEEVQFGGMKIGFPGGRPTIQSSDGAYAFSVGLAFHEDFGGFIGNRPRAGEAKGAFNGFTSNMRRLRIPFTFRYKDFVAAVTPDFGANHNDGYVGLYEGNLNYTGLRNTILTVGYFQPRVTEEDAESSNDFFTLERPSITDMVRNIAAGDARFSVGGLHYEKRWWIAGYFTGQEWGHRNPSDNGATYYGGGSGNTIDSQTGGLLRIAGRPIATKDVDLHMGVSSIAAFKLPCNTGSNANFCTRSASFGQRPEFDIGEGNLVATGAIPYAAEVWAAGPELGLRWKRLVVKGEYYHVGVQRSRADLPTIGFQGWYGSAAYTIFGKPRAYNYKSAAFTAPGVVAGEEFDPANNHWGALEVVGHYSLLDLNSNLGNAGNGNVGNGLYFVRGGQQTVWQGGLNWYPNRHFAVKVDYSHFITSRSTQATNLVGRTGDSIAARVQAAF